jgi:hypothetical protein
MTKTKKKILYNSDLDYYYVLSLFFFELETRCACFGLSFSALYMLVVVPLRARFLFYPSFEIPALKKKQQQQHTFLKYNDSSIANHFLVC